MTSVAQGSDSRHSASRNQSADSSRSHSWIDMSTLMRIKDLQLRAKSVVDGFHNGLHRSPLHGFSVEFSEYRPYSDGDDPRTIDWKLFARSDRYYIKKFEDETNRRCYLVVDQSRSMAFQSLDYSKLEYARTLVATLAYYLTTQRDAVGLLTFDEDIVEVLTARFRTGQLKRILSLLEREVAGLATDLVRPLKHLAELVRQRSLMIVVSDFLASVESLQTPLSFLRARHHEVMLIRVLDPVEVDLSLDSAMMMRDMESGKEMYINPRTASARYRERFVNHERDLIQLCSRLGIGLTSLRTDQSLELALFDLLSRQQSMHVEAKAVEPRTPPIAASGMRGPG